METATTTPFSSNQWVHLAVSVDQENNNIKLFANGNLLKESSNVPVNLSRENMSQLLIGKSVMSDSSLKGYIDDVTIFDQALNETSMNEVYANSITTTEATLPLNQWSHVTATHNAHQKRVDMYVNGKPYGFYENFEGVLTNNQNDIKIGNGFTGEIGEAVIYERPLFKSETTALVTDIERLKDGLLLVRTNFPVTEKLPSNTLANRSVSSVQQGEIVLSATANYTVGHVVGSKALVFDGNQDATLTLTSNHYFNDLMVYAMVKPTTDATTRSIVSVAGVFDFYMNAANQLAFKMVSDGVEHAMTETITVNEYTIVGLTLNRYNNRVTLTKGSVDQVFTDVTLAMPSHNVVKIGETFVGHLTELQIALGNNDVQTEDYNNTKVLLEFTFDEASGAQAMDMSELKNNGTIMNGALRKYGTYDVLSKGLQLDATANQYISVPGAVYANRGLGTSTMSAWVYTSNNGSASDKKHIIQQPGSFDFYVDGTGAIFFNNVSTNETYQSTELVNNNTWTHISVSLNEFSNTVKFFKNGSISNTATPTTSTKLPMTSTNVEIGKGLTGVLDNVMIHLGFMDVSQTTSLYRIPDYKYKPESIAAEEWSHIVAVYNRDLNMVTMYQNGMYIGCYDKYLKSDENIGTNTNDILIATTGDSTTFYDGIMDDVRVYKRALTKAEVEELYSMYKTPTFYIDRTVEIAPTFTFNATPSVEFGPLTVGDPNPSDFVSLGFAEQGPNMGTQILDNGYTLQFTWPSSWQVLTTDKVMVDTSTLGNTYAFEYKELNQGTQGYMVLGFSRISNPGTGWSITSTNGLNMLLNWHSTISRHDGRNTYETGTAFENGSLQCEFWRFTVVENTSGSGVKYNDILYEGFTSADRTPETRTLYGLASRMHYSGTISDGETFFANNNQLYLRLGGLNTGKGVFKNFRKVTSLRYYAFAVESDRLTNKSDFDFFLNNLDSIPTTGYKTTLTGASSWTPETLDKVLSSQLSTFADVSQKLSVYTYLIAQNTANGNLDYLRKKVARTFDPVALSLDTAIAGDYTQITVLSGSATSVKQYYIFAFNGQALEEEVIAFAKSRLNTITSTGMTTIDGHDVYSYKVSGVLPTTSSHVIATDITLSNAFYSLVDVTTPVAISANTPFTTYIVGVDTANVYHVNNYGYTPVKEQIILETRTVEWDAIDNINPSYDISSSKNSHTLNGAYATRLSISADGTTALVTGFKNNTSGDAFVWQYDTVSNSWGKYNADGTFTAGTPHNLSKSGVTGTYGRTGSVSWDGKTVVISGDDTTTSGCAYVWHYDESTHAWGKYNSDRSFTAGTPYDLSSSVFTTSTNGSYGYACNISGDGKSVVVSGNKDMTEGCAFVWQYNENSSEWGKYDSNGTFVANSPQDLSSYLFTTDTKGRYGNKCDISADGTAIVIAGQNNTTNNSGCAFVWFFNKNLSSWGSPYDISSDKISFITSAQNYGQCVSISMDGKSVLISASIDSTTNAGQAFVWQFNETTSAWGKYNLDGSFITNTPNNLSVTSGAGGYYGTSCDISADGKTAIVSGYSSANSGKAFLWQLNESTKTWEITNTISKSGQEGAFGMECTMSADGSTVLIGGYKSYSFLPGAALIWKAPVRNVYTPTSPTTVDSYLRNNVETTTMPIEFPETTSDRLLFNNLTGKPVGYTFRIMFDPNSPRLSSSFPDYNVRFDLNVGGAWFRMLDMALSKAYTGLDNGIHYRLMSELWYGTGANTTVFNPELTWSNITSDGQAYGSISNIGRPSGLQFEVVENDVKIQILNDQNVWVAEWMASYSNPSQGTYNDTDRGIIIGGYWNFMSTQLHPLIITEISEFSIIASPEPPTYIPIDSYATVTDELVEQSVTYEMNDPTTASGITLNTGSLVVGTQKPVDKLALIAFTGIEPSEDEVLLFYKNNIRNLSASTESAYINTNGFNLEETVDLSTLGVSVTSAFKDLSGSSTEAIVDGGEYFVFMLVEDINDTVSVNPFVFFLPYKGTRNVTYTNIASGTTLNTNLIVRSSTGSTNHISSGSFNARTHKISRDGMFMVSSTIIDYTSGNAYVYKNTASDPSTQDPTYELYADLSSNGTIFTTYGATIDGRYGYGNAISGDGKYVVISGFKNPSSSSTNNCCLYVFKHDEINNTYVMYQDLSSNTTNVPGNINGNTYSYADLSLVNIYYTFGFDVKITDDAKYIYAFARHHNVGNFGLLIFKHNGSSYDFYQILQGTVLNITESFSNSADGKILAFGGWKDGGSYNGTNRSTRMDIYVGIRFYIRNDTTNMYEELQYIEQFNLNYSSSSNVNNNYAVQGYLRNTVLSYDGTYCLIAGESIDRTGTGVHYGLAILYEFNGTEYVEKHNLNKVGDILTNNNIAYYYYWDTRPGSNASGPNMMAYSDMSADGSYIALSNGGYTTILLIFKRNQETGVYDIDTFYQNNSDSAPRFRELKMHPSGKYLNIRSSSTNVNIMKGEDIV